MSALEAAKEILDKFGVAHHHWCVSCAEIIDRLAVQPAVKASLAERDSEPDWHKFYTESQVNYLHCQELLAERYARAEEMRECINDLMWAINFEPSCQKRLITRCQCLACAKAEAERILAQTAPTVLASPEEKK